MCGVERWSGLSALGAVAGSSWGVAPGWDGDGALPLNPAPALTQQCRIVVKVEQRMALADRLETQLAKTCVTAHGRRTHLRRCGRRPQRQRCASSQPRATPWEDARKTHPGLKARPDMPTRISFAHRFHCVDHDGPRLQRSGNLCASLPGAMPQAGMGRALGPATSPVPFLAAQRWIVGKVLQRMAWVDGLETQLATRVAELLASDFVLKKSLT